MRLQAVVNDQTLGGDGHVQAVNDDEKPDHDAVRG